MFCSFQCMICNSLVNFIPKCYILFDVIVKEIVLFLLSSYPLLVYRNTVNFCILILYPEILLNLFISCNSLCVCEFLRIFYIQYYAIYKQKQSHIFLSNLYTFFSCLIAQARTSSAIFNTSDKNAYPCVIPDLSKNASGLLPLSLMSPVNFSQMAFISLRKLPSVPSLFFHHERLLHFAEHFFCLY